jgi:putative iron-regulated protein
VLRLESNSCGGSLAWLGLILGALGLLAAAAAGPGPVGEGARDGRTKETPGGDGILRSNVVHTYAALAYASYQDSLAMAVKLEHAVQTLVKSPSAAAMADARAAWITARTPYLQTEVCRFYDGPIEDVEGFVNAWPIDENMIDYVAEDPSSGLINNPSQHPAITREVLADLNEKQGERSITTGYHAVEFLLWGQDQRVDGGGQRPWSDYATAPNAARRGAYLQAVTQLLTQHLATVTAAWAPGDPQNYRGRFVALGSEVALGKILKGMGSLSGPELAGERLTVAYQTKEQEDEHSCFSDTTHLDFRGNARGIANVYLGRYRTVQGAEIVGPGLHDLLLREQPSLAAVLGGQIEASVRAAGAIPAPFDQAVLGADGTAGRQAVRQAIKAFQSQAETIAKVAASLGLPLNL